MLLIAAFMQLIRLNNLRRRVCEMSQARQQNLRYPSFSYQILRHRIFDYHRFRYSISRYQNVRQRIFQYQNSRYPVFGSNVSLFLCFSALNLFSTPHAFSTLDHIFYMNPELIFYMRFYAHDWMSYTCMSKLYMETPHLISNFPTDTRHSMKTFCTSNSRATAS